MTDLLTPDPVAPEPVALLAGPGGRPPISSRRIVLLRRLVGVLAIVLAVGWATLRAFPPGSDLVNHGGLALLGDLLATTLHPALSPDFLAVVAHDTLVTVAYAVLGAAGALLLGLLGGLALSDVAWGHTPSAPVRALRLLLRGVLVGIRSVHELIWALLLVGVLGLDSLVAVLALALPFGAQTAQVFGQTFDGVPPGPLVALRRAGSRPVPALVYGLFPGAAPLLLSYSFYRLECAIRSTVLLGVVGVGGLGAELVVSLQSRNWGEVWTLIGAVLLLSAVVDLWSSRLRAKLDVVSCSEWSVERRENPGSRRDPGSRWTRVTLVLVPPALVAAWLASGVSPTGLFSARTRDLTGRLAEELWPPQLPTGGWPPLMGSVLDTVAMAVLAMTVAVVVTVLVGPWAVGRRGHADSSRLPARVLRSGMWWGTRLVLLVLRSVPPTVWAVLALLALFPGVLPGALALGLYTGGILGRLAAEAWESIDHQPRDALRRAGVPRSLATIAASVPPSAHQLVTYTLYRFEICVRETAVVGVVGAAGLGRLFTENLSAFRYPVVSTLLLASLAVSVAAEFLSRRIRLALRA